METTELALEKKAVLVNGKRYEIGKVTVAQVVKLVKLLAGSLDELKSQVRPGMDNQAVTGALLSSLDAETINGIVCVFIGEDVPDISFEDALEVVAVACEINDIEKILKNVERVTSAISRKQAN